jgi:lysozyme
MMRRRVLLSIVAVCVATTAAIAQEEETRPHLFVHRDGGAKTYDNLELLKIELISQNNAVLGSVNAVSGQSWAQVFRTAKESKSGSYEPLPEGLWKVEYPNKGTNGVEWAGGVAGDYSTYWEPALGPVWLGIVPQEGFETDRKYIGIHLDGNRWESPGTAGCLGITTMSDLKKFVSWFSSVKTAPRVVVVDWGLGSLPLSSRKKEE